MTDLLEEEISNDQEKSQSVWLWLAAVAVIAVPIVIGFVLLRGTGDESDVVGGPAGAAESDQGMGGGMGGGESAPADLPAGVKDFAEIQATEIRFEFDPDLGAATLFVDTTVDVACSVVYGPTQSFGSIATDTDMAGGAHAVHQPRLTDLTGGTYFYRLQGAAADGSLYQSELAQFTFPEGGAPVPEVQPPLPNVATTARITDFSSEYSDAYAARNAIDGDPSTEWSSAGDGDDAYIVLDFGENMRVRGVGFRTRSMTDGTSITTSFTVTVEGRSYGPFEAGPGMAIGLFDASGQQVRVDVETSTGGNTGAIEIEVYAEPEM